MALFNFKKEDKAKGKSGTKRVVSTSDSFEQNSDVLKSMRITEKVSFLAQNNNVYTFNISGDANKKMISEVIARKYNVHPEKVRIVPVPSKRVFVRGKRGVKSGGRKAYVFLKKGEKIEIA